MDNLGHALIMGGALALLLVCILAAVQVAGWMFSPAGFWEAPEPPEADDLAMSGVDRA